MKENFFVFENVICGYADTMVVRGVSSALGSGKVLGIVGRNGVGKSTLMKGLAGFLPISSGNVILKGSDLSRIPSHARVKMGMAYAPQENVVFGELSVEDNLWLHLPDHDVGRYSAALAEFPRLTERRLQRAGLLSGGERKLLSFARTLGLQAPLSLLDEPTEGVQPENIDRMANLVNRAKAESRSFVVVEQNLTFIEQIADEVMVLDHGEVVLTLTKSEISRERMEKHMLL